mmetsp:Transcript_13218/g.23511  ORF Transcript_13218/g.23511 Transcript_13218/m.23511 type:complete len:436 (-) Transcript_13218:97-1404(-)
MQLRSCLDAAGRSPSVNVLAVSLAVWLACVTAVHGAQDGLARTPPMGWRSWNQYGRNVDDSVIRSTAAAMTVRRDQSGARDADGMSLLDLGYNDVGLDDFWQACGKGADGTFHTPEGVPLVNEDRFPDMGEMVTYIHGLGLKAGWYHNNCICRETKANVWQGNNHTAGDVSATLQYGFDSVKLDGCGAFRDLDLWYDLFSADQANTVMIENCHWGGNPPTESWCPFHMYRTSGDIKPTWRSFYGNLQSTKKFQGQVPLSRPGCWAYPDMLEVGKLEDELEDRAHFGAWVITSSPLILGHNVTDEDTNRRIWKIIANEAAIQINQDWAGHPGRLVTEFTGKGKRKIQIWSKPLPADALGIFVINDNARTSQDTVKITFEDLGLARDTQLNVTNVWTGEQDNGIVREGELHLSVAGHDSVLLRLDPQPVLFDTQELV